MRDFLNAAFLYALLWYNICMRHKTTPKLLAILLGLICAQSLFAQDDSDASCRLSTLPKNNSIVQISSSGESKRVSVSANNSVCVWAVMSDSAWLSADPDSGMGNGAVNVSAQPNKTSKPRKGTVTFIDSLGNTAAAIIFTQEFAYTACDITVSAERQPFLDYNGGSGAIFVRASDSSCNWNAHSNIGWISLSSGTSGRGDGTVYYTVMTNNSPNSRRGTIMVSDKSIVIIQNGRPQESSTRTIYTPPTRKIKKTR